MTIFEAYLKFNGLACPHCKKKVSIDYCGNTLHQPFMGFVSNEKINNCCLKFYEHLTDHLFMYRNNSITEAELMRELSKFKKAELVG